MKKLALISATLLLLLQGTTHAAEEKSTWPRTLGYTLLLQGVSFALLAGFDPDGDDPSRTNFRRAFSEGPETEDDSIFFNYVLHPIAGSEYFLRARETGASIYGSFLYSAAASAFWEFVIESWIARPSKQDLIITPVLGSLLGEFRYHIKSSVEDSEWYIDPIYRLLFGSVHLDVRVKEKRLLPVIAFDHRF